MKRKYKIKFANGEKLSFFVNDLSGCYWGELWIKNPSKISNSKFNIANPFQFKDSTLDGFFNQIKEFVSKNFEGDYTIEDF